MGGRRFLVGHGGAYPDEAVLVPQGCTVHFYAPQGHLLADTVILGVLMSERPSLQSFGESADDCPNIVLQPWEDASIAQAMSALVDDRDVVFVGDARYPLYSHGLALCENPVECAAAGEHSCGGWLDLLSDTAEVHVLACLAPVGVYADQMQMAMAGEDSQDTLGEYLEEQVKRFLVLPEAEQLALWEAWPQGTKAMLLTYVRIEHWHAVQAARRALWEEGRFALARHAVLVAEHERQVLRGDDELRDAMDGATTWLSNWTNGVWLPDDAARELAALEERDIRVLRESSPDLVDMLQDWVEHFPAGMTDDALTALVHTRNTEVLRKITSDQMLDCACGPDLLVLDPAGLDAAEVVWQASLERAIAHWPVSPSALSVRVQAGRLVLGGAVARRYEEYWPDLVAEVPDLRLAMARSGRVEARDLAKLHESFALVPTAGKLLAAVERVNTGGELPAASDALFAAIDAHEKALEALERYPAATAVQVFDDWQTVVAQVLEVCAVALDALDDGGLTEVAEFPALPALTEVEEFARLAGSPRFTAALDAVTAVPVLAGAVRTALVTAPDDAADRADELADACAAVTEPVLVMREVFDGLPRWVAGVRRDLAELRRRAQWL
ncbi:hypothetical protein UK23_31110 [Lentzea aerocolonigenes]|uniref:Putative adhesin Stv domain-containing protein n=1 Tax=Lentzea aerocolonigenes TaxID=68170 RepID=A0A0F0GKF1_LENAE|nr:hypothetical protein [Lentzea aerocolonigenes]KJK43999.1 hypothetical protein UK23_31110 [Lentzea aerocolonigenes]